MNFLDQNILTIVAFLPLAGAILLACIPRRDRDIRYFALAVSLITLIASLHLPWHYVRGQSGFQFEQNISVDFASEHPLPPWHRRHLDVAGHPDHLPDAAVRADLVEVDRPSGEGILRPDADPGDGHDRRLYGARPVPLLLLLGSDADPDGAAYRHVRAWPQDLRRREVFPLHHDRLGLHAGGDHLAVRAHRQLRLRHHSASASRTDKSPDSARLRSGSSWASS